MKASRHLEKLEHFKAYNPTAAQLWEAQQHEVEEADTFTRRQKVVIGICSLVAAAIMIETLFFKFTGAAESKYIFSKMGTEPWMRWTQGIWELLASIGLLLPRMRWAGGILTTGAMAAAILSHMTWLGYSIQGDHGLLFCMALVTFACGVTVMWLHRHHIPGYVPTSPY
ncbi:MAG: DoxX family protein [Pedosphaera sp.]|nr:DoxX family protein [Pedosphaera sp.]